jgi:hypothetical protein
MNRVRSIRIGVGRKKRARGAFFKWPEVVQSSTGSLMRSEIDKEMDSLLREGARRARAASVERGAAAAGVRATPSGAHLDADEQSAYAENSLPPSARTHYAAHLADCDDCRRSVTQLALAAGMPAQLEQSAAVAGKEVSSNVASSSVAPANVASSHGTWRERLGALFAPRAWRYAVPALALLLVGAVALVVLRREPRLDVSVAEQRNKTEQTKPAMPEMNHAPQNGNAAAPGVLSAEGDGQPASNTNAPLAKEELAAVVREDQGQPKAGAVLKDADTAPPAPPISPGVGTTTSAPAATAAVEMPTPMPTPAPAAEPFIAQDAEAKAKAAGRAEELARDAQRQGNYEINQQQQREQISGPRRNEQSRNARGRSAEVARDGADRNDAAPAAPAPSGVARRAKARGADAEREARRSDDSVRNEGASSSKSTAETRTVAGRKFRRAGGAWIDTAYNSSQSVTVVRRNSEQYRALVADEPELRRIGDALGGEVTVLWKGRAYRIR